MQSAPGLRSHFSGVWKNNLLFASPSIRRPTGKVSGYEGFIAIGVGLAFAFTISMFAEIFTYMYYESKN